LFTSAKLVGFSIYYNR